MNARRSANHRARQLNPDQMGMPGDTPRRKLSPGLTGALLLLLLLLTRALASASAERVFIAGRELPWECLFQKWFAIPCPTCGLTRGILLTLHGQLAAAWQINPAGPLLVFGILLFSGAMFCLMFYQTSRSPLIAGQAHRRIRLASTAYGVMVVAVLLMHWLGEII